MLCLIVIQGLETGSLGQKQVRCPTCKLLTILASGLEVKHLPKPVTVTQYKETVEALLNKQTVRSAI